MLQIVFGKVVLVASLTVDRPLCKWLRVNIRFAKAVDYDVGVNVACAVFTIGVGTDQSLMPRKIGLCIFHADGLRPLTSQVVVSVVFRIVADDVVVAFDFIVSVVLVILLVRSCQKFFKQICLWDLVHGIGIIFIIQIVGAI